jgi:hypothetical protein
VAMSLPDGEPEAGPWRVVPITDLVQIVLGATEPRSGRPAVVAVDGRGASGKSTLAGLLTATAPGSVAVHTDDIAWNQSFFGWADLLAEGVLEPARRGRAVRYRPPAWDAHGRRGAIEVPTGLDLLVVEGVGAGRRELGPMLDAIVWVQSDFGEAERRGIARDIEHGMNGGTAETIAFWHTWMAEELLFFAQDRPWERACVTVAGTTPLSHRPDEVVVADPTGAG